MASFLEFFKFAINNYQTILQGVLAICVAMSALFSALTSIALLIPGAQPEKFFQDAGAFFNRIGNWLSKYSKKSPPTLEAPALSVDAQNVANAPDKKA